MDLALLVPASLTEESPDPRVRTYKVGTIGRAAATFGVREVLVYHDRAAPRDDTGFIGTVLTYQATAPYLRKRVFPKLPELRYAGVLPPLNLPTHVVGREPREGEVREALVTAGGLDVGLPRPAELVAGPEGDGAGGAADPETGERFPVEVVAVAREGVRVRRLPAAAAAGFRVGRADGLGAALADYGTRVGTSRHGDPVHQHAATLRDLLAPEPAGERPAVALAFGAPGRGIGEILEAEGSSSSEALDVVLNTVVGQHTASVRTEEAVWVTLGILNALARGL